MSIVLIVSITEKNIEDDKNTISVHVKNICLDATPIEAIIARTLLQEIKEYETESPENDSKTYPETIGNAHKEVE